MLRLIALSLLSVTACGPSSSTGGPCTGNETRCNQNGSYEVCVDGTFTVLDDCGGECSPGVGCIKCDPGEAKCMDNGSSEVCKSDGSGFETENCDASLGLSCGDSGKCEGPCSRAALGSSYIGCEYFATPTANGVDGATFGYAVVMANASSDTARVTISGGGLAAPTVVTVAPDSVSTQTLPWVDQLQTWFECSRTESVCVLEVAGICIQRQDLCVEGDRKSVTAAGGAYHIQSDTPITVYQFNPLEYQAGTEFSFSNDASLLIPTNAMGTEHMVASYPGCTECVSPYPDGYTSPIPSIPGFFSVTATQDNTTVSVNPSVATLGGTGVGAIAAGSSETVTLNKGDVLQVLGEGASADLSGSMVSSSERVIITGGHLCAFVPLDLFACDHLEETIFPTEALSDKYIVAQPTVPGDESRVRLVRITATAAGTTLSYNPPVSGAPTTIGKAGEVVEFMTNQTFEVTGSSKILVASFMRGQGEDTESTGDPSMALSIPVDQYRLDYRFLAPTNYETNFVNIIAPSGANVQLDGNTVSGFTAIGNTGFSLATVPLAAGGQGNSSHKATSSEPFGISVYGYGQFTSYWYPGGLNLKPIVID